MLARVSLEVSKHNAKILSAFLDAPSLSKTAKWSFFADFTKADVEPETLATELRSLPSVLQVRCQSSIDGFITDTMHFPVMLGTERAIIVRSAILASVIGRIKSIFGSESSSARVILYQIGEAGGQRVFDSLKALVGFEFIRKNVGRTLNLFTALGYGILNVKAVDLDAKTAYIHIQGGFESADSRSASVTPQCHFIRGLLGGWFSQLFESRIEVIETQCVAKGNPACVFQVQPFKR